MRSTHHLKLIACGLQATGKKEVDTEKESILLAQPAAGMLLSFYCVFTANIASNN
jgi:hypothetical protein